MVFRPASVNLGSVGATAAVTITGTGFPTGMLAMQASLQYDKNVISISDPTCTGVFEGGSGIAGDLTTGKLVACFLFSPVSVTQGDLMTLTITRLAPGATTVTFVVSGMNTQYSTAAQLGATAFTASGNFIARPFAAPVVDGARPVVSATFYAPGAPRTGWLGVSYTFDRPAR